MRDKYPIIILTLIIGIIWFFWHLPLFFIKELHFIDKSFFSYLLSTVMFSGFLSFLILKTKSVALAVIMHASINIAANYGNILTANYGFSIYLALVVLTLVSFYLIYKTEDEIVLKK